MFRMRLAGFWIGHDAGKAEFEHQSFDSFPVDLIALPSQVVHHPSTTIEWMPGEFLIDQFQQFQLFGIHLMDCWFQVVGRAIRPSAGASAQSPHDDKKMDTPKGAVYSVKVLLDKSAMTIDGHQVPLTPGMSVSIEIKTGSRSANNKAASKLLVSALAAHDASLQITMEGVIQAYFDAMTAQSLVIARIKMAGISERILAATKRREDRGVAPLSDTLQAETALAKALLNESRAQGDFNKALSLLVQAMGLAPGTALCLPQSLELYRTDELKNLENWLHDAAEKHPAIRQAHAKLAADKAKVTVARSEGFPSLDATAYISINGYPTQGLSSVDQTVKVAGVTLNVPIFDGFARTYKIQGAKAQAEQSEAQLQDMTNQVLTEVVKAHAAALTSLGTLKATERLMTAATQGLQSSLRRYERHAADILELLNSQSSLADAEQERIRAIAEWRSARLRLLANSGVLGRADLAQEQP